MGDARRQRGQREDVPANASDLRTLEELRFEFVREQLRFVQERRKSFRYLRAAFVAVLALATVAAMAAVFTLGVGLAADHPAFVVPSLWTLTASTGGSVFLLRFYAGKVLAKGAPA